jgi:phospholipase/carboxylesterase
MIINRFEAAGLNCIEVAPGDAPGRDLPLFICLHGRGDWGESYLNLVPAISQSDYRYVFPTAPLALAEALFEWFRLDSGDISRGARSARATVTTLVNELRERFQTPAHRVVLGGFSQGGMMAFEVGLRYPENLAGLVVLSGMLLTEAPFSFMNPPSPAVYYAQVKADLKEILAEIARRQTPVFIGHGAYDPVVPVTAGRSAAQLLKQAGVPVEYYEFPGQHEISPEELQKVKTFLQRVTSK